MGGERDDERGRAFLTFNAAFSIQLCNTYLQRFDEVWFQFMPLCLRNPGGSIWFRRE